VYRDFVYRARRREHNRRVLRRLRYFHETKIARLCFHTWARYARGRKAARTAMKFASSITARIKQHAAFGALRRHALASIAALEIQRVFRGMRGRMRAEEAWRQMQATPEPPRHSHPKGLSWEVGTDPSKTGTASILLSRDGNDSAGAGGLPCICTRRDGSPVAAFLS
jgi:hypothetical protein